MQETCFLLAIVCYIASLVVFAVMVTKLPRHKRNGTWIIAWALPAALYVVLIFPGRGVTRSAGHGFGKPGYVLAWLLGGAGVWIGLCFIIFSIVTRLPAVKKSSAHH